MVFRVLEENEVHKVLEEIWVRRVYKVIEEKPVLEVHKD